MPTSYSRDSWFNLRSDRPEASSTLNYEEMSFHVNSETKDIHSCMYTYIRKILLFNDVVTNNFTQTTEFQEIESWSQLLLTI